MPIETTDNGIIVNWQRDVEKYRPNHWICEGCPDWDNVNGCWRGFEDWRDCDYDEWEDYEEVDESDPEYLCVRCLRNQAIANGLCHMCSELYANDLR